MNPKDVACPMLLAPKPGGQGWSDRYVTSQELNSFLKKLFANGGVDGPSQDERLQLIQ